VGVIVWSHENMHTHVGRSLNLLGLAVLCSVSVKGIIGPFFLSDIVFGA
jgi:hypothetical protein